MAKQITVKAQVTLQSEVEVKLTMSQEIFDKMDDSTQDQLIKDAMNLNKVSKDAKISGMDVLDVTEEEK
ncbi:hypothetical protein phiG2_06 [Lysinibacillus phage phiG2]|nr:hypothetical protein phiG2_06 [Lysinibacillus phage phiG2]